MLSNRQVAGAAGVVIASTALAGTALGQGSPQRAADRPVQAPAVPGAQAISSRDRVYTADQSSNTVSVIDPKANTVLGTIALGQDRLDQVLGPVDETQVNVHGLGFSRDGRLLDVISVTSNAAQIIDTSRKRGHQPHDLRRALAA